MGKVWLEKTRSGLPALWEKGGGWTNTGEATIIAGPDGRPKRPIYIRRRGHLAGGEHALFVIRHGDHIVEARHHRGDFHIQVYRVEAIGEEDGRPYAEAGLVAEHDMGEWAPPLPPYLQAAVEAAREKARCYHCRSPHYVAAEA